MGDQTTQVKPASVGMDGCSLGSFAILTLLVVSATPVRAGDSEAHRSTTVPARAEPRPVIEAVNKTANSPSIASRLSPVRLPAVVTARNPAVGLPLLPPPEAMRYTDPAAIVAPQPSQFQVAPEPLPAPPERIRPEEVRPKPVLTLEQVLTSVEDDFPLLAAFFAERGIAAGQLLAAEGPFNTKFTSYNKTYPLGGYRYTVSDTFLQQPTWKGGEGYAGYRIGVGPTFPIWYGELETNKGGEFRAGYAQSLLQGFAIDKRRAASFKARIARSAAEPDIQKQRIEFLQSAATAYWSWVAAGRRFVISRQILKVAEDRDKILAERERLREIAPIERVDNRRIVLDRQSKLVAAGRRFQEAAIKLSLFYRDASGLPALPEPDQLPRQFPAIQPPRPERLPVDVERALVERPELRSLALKRQSAQISLSLAQNQTLPLLDGSFGVAQDVGPEEPGFFKSPFQLEAGLVGSVPLQRSAARGDRLTAEAQIAQLMAQTRWTRDKITAEVQDAMSALIASYEQIPPIRESVQLTYRVEVAERERYFRGDSNLFAVNIRELQTADTALLEVDALAGYFIEQADYLAALGLDALRRRVAGPLAVP